MTWVMVVKFWAYQAYQLQIIVYIKTMRTIHGLELFSSANRQWVLFYGPNKNTALPVAVSKKFAEFATHCGTATSINAIPDFANSFHSLTKIGFNSSDGNDESIFLMISLGQM